MLGYLLLKIKNEKILIDGKYYEAELQYFEKSDQKMIKDLYFYWKKLKSGMGEIKSRHPNLPEGISEGAFAIFFNSPRVLNVTGTSGSFDNYDKETHERIQVKATTIETDLTSFGPKSVWDVLYFLDFYRDGKFDGKFDVYKIPGKINIKNIQVSKTKTFREIQNTGKRPRFSIKGKIIRPEKIKPVKTCQL